jgi:hypothetical protein
MLASSILADHVEAVWTQLVKASTLIVANVTLALKRTSWRGRSSVGTSMIVAVTTVDLVYAKILLATILASVQQAIT